MWFNLEMNLQRWSYQTSIYNLKLSFLISCFLNEDAKSTFCILKKFQMKKRKEFVYLSFVLNGLAKIATFIELLFWICNSRQYWDGVFAIGYLRASWWNIFYFETEFWLAVVFQITRIFKTSMGIILSSATYLLAIKLTSNLTH